MSAPTLITGEHDENSFDITENRGQPGNRLVLGIPIPSALAIPSLEDGHTNRTESCSRFHVDVVKPCLSAKWFVTSYMQLLQHVDGGGQS
ncbi:hypothetical protein V6N11_060055 [Hibiscus sabdariffa]|uniref:Uncharacterized protein n=1 Tax=Hibiscus sabdariffa TaxID=183260 RepID=A0ABR1ZCL4_9ROSI